MLAKGGITVANHSQQFIQGFDKSIAVIFVRWCGHGYSIRDLYRIQYMSNTARLFQVHSGANTRVNNPL